MIGMNLKYLRNKNALTQEQLAEKLEVSRQTVAKWESGESLPDIEKCAKAAGFFHITIDMLATCKLDESSENENFGSGDGYVFGIVKVGERGQVVIPKNAREVYGIKPGDKLLAVGDKRGMAFAKVKRLAQFCYDD